MFDREKAENVIIGTLIEMPEYFDSVKHELTEDLFKGDMTQKVYKNIVARHEDGRAWDAALLAEDHKPYAQAIKDLATEWELYLKFIEHLKNLQIETLATDLREEFMNRAGDVDVNKIKQIVDGFQMISHRKKEKTTEQLFHELANHVVEAGHNPPELDTVFSQINRWIGGFTRQQIILIIAATGHSKSLFLWNLLIKPLMDGKKVIVYDYEMPEKNLLMRLVAMHYKIPLDWMLDGKHHTGRREMITSSERTEALLCIGKMNDKVKENLIIRVDARIEEIERDCINLKPDIVVIDTIQAFCKKHKKPNGTNNADHITDMCSQLNHIVKINEVAMIQCAQVNRATDGAVPGQANIRESSGIADNAAVILGVRDRSKISDKEEDQNIFDVKIDKNRHGEQGGLKFFMNKAIARVFEYASQQTIEEERKNPTPPPTRRIVKMKLFNNKVLIKHQAKKEKNEKGVILPKSAQKPSYQGTIVAVGPGKTTITGELIPMELKKGDEVYFNPQGAIELEMKHGKFLLSSEDQIFMKLDKDEW